MTREGGRGHMIKTFNITLRILEFLLGTMENLWKDGERGNVFRFLFYNIRVMICITLQIINFGNYHIFPPPPFDIHHVLLLSMFGHYSSTVIQ